MSQRAKRPNRSDDGTVPTKRRKGRPTAEEEEAAALAAAAASWQPRPLNDLKSIYNRTTTEAPAELFRKDLISAMKLPDSEPLAFDEYWIITDQWKQEWERGVQVPVNPDSLPEPSVTVNHCVSVVKPQNEFKLPKNKYIRITKDEQFKLEEHMLSNAPAQAEAACSYDLDECDASWLKLLNGERAASGLNAVSEDQLERVLERLELHCWDRIQGILRNEEGLGIEYDENVICDVCRSPDSEEGNEMVFCDSCNICVHQACYGITKIPAGQWLCCTCAISQKPECVLCPNKGGAMKSTRSGQKWAHVSCSLWIPEVSIGCVEKMEPITKISSIPQSRWALICVLCRERVGACIQCSVKTCKTAYHVTCAFKHGLEMRAIIEDENADDGVKLRSYCEKHSVCSKKEKSVCSGSEDDDSKRKKRKDMTSEEKNQARAARLQEIEAEFDKHVSVTDVTLQMDVDSEALQYIYNYWKLKRKAGHNKPLLPPKSEDVDMLSHKQEQADIEKMKMFVQLRQDLERVRNLCYMVSRREKLSRSFFRMREQTFHKQAAVLASGGYSLAAPVVAAVIEANHGPSIYDRLYSHGEAEDHTTDFDTVLARIAGLKSPAHDSEEDRKSDLNGLLKNANRNPYKRHYFNGSSKRRSTSLYGSSLSSASSSDERPKDKKDLSMTDDEKSPMSTANKKKQSSARNHSDSRKAEERRRQRRSIAATKLGSSSEDDVKPIKKECSQYPARGSTLIQMERELIDGFGSDSDDLAIPVPTANSHKVISEIYSDSDTSDTSAKNDDKSSNAASDSQQNRLRTKAAVKEFSLHSKPSNKNQNKSSPDGKKKVKEKDDVRVTPTKPSKKKDYVPSDLIVPQRQAAKKASENMRSTQAPRAKETAASEPEPTKPIALLDEKVKTKNKHKPSKDVRDNREPKEREYRKDRELKDGKQMLQQDVFDIDREFDKEDGQEILAYVPQRQAAKKAAEHIKSGLGKPGAPEAEPEKVKKEIEPGKTKKDAEPVKVKRDTLPDKSNKISNVKRKSTSSSASSSSSSSTDSSSSSSSESDVDSNKIDAKKPLPSLADNHPSFLPHDTSKRNSAKDWPFLDKAAKSTARAPSSSSSDSTDSTTPPRRKSFSQSKSPKSKKSDTSTTIKKQQESTESTRMSSKKERKVPDKKPKLAPAPTVAREEPARARRKSRGSGRGKKSNESSDRIRDAHVRSGDISDSQRSDVERERFDDREEQHKYEARKRKSDEVADHSGHRETNKHSEKESIKSSQFSSSIRKTDKKLNDKVRDKSIEPEVSKLEREIMERKAGRDTVGSKNSKGTLNKLFEKRDKKVDKDSTIKENKEPVQENKVSPKKSPSKSKPTEEIPTSKTCSNEKEPLETKVQKKKVSPKSKKTDPDESIGKHNILENKSSNAEHGNKSATSVNITSNKITVESDKNVLHMAQVDSDSNMKKNQSKTLAPPFQGHSLFSPQPMIKDNACTELFDDFDNMLDENFVICRDDELNRPFSYNNEFLFKEDSKEDSARETLNLVEKLRMGLSKKSTSQEVDDNVGAGNLKNETENKNAPIETDIMEKYDNVNVNEVISNTQINCSLEMRISESIYNEEHRNADCRFTCQANVPVDEITNITPLQHDPMDHSVSAQADERWVPPSTNYQTSIPSLPANQKQIADHNNILNTDPKHAYMSQFQEHQPHHMVSDQLNPPIDIRLQEMDHLCKNQSPTMLDRRVSVTPYLDPGSMYCMPSPSPYGDMNTQAKWADSKVMPARRSSSSSGASTSSTCSRRSEDELQNRDMVVPHLPIPEMDIHGMPPFSFTPNALTDGLPFHPFSEASQFVSAPVSRLPTAAINTQCAFPSPGAAMFPPNFATPFSATHSVIPPIPKSVEETLHFQPPCTATFTSSKCNMALIDEIVSKPVESIPTEEEQVQPPATPQTPFVAPIEDVPPSPALSNSTPTSNHISSPNPALKSNAAPAGKKSPNKPTRTSARFSSQQSKSPSKSPGKSPRQEPAPRSTSSGRGRGEKRGGSKSGASRGSHGQSRGRGRGRGRGRANQHSDMDYTGNNAIHNPLAGTVYDLNFDDDISNENMADLRTMRERRRSVDVHERKSDSSHLSGDSSPSPKFTSPSHPKNRSSYSTDLRTLRPPTPITEEQAKLSSPLPVINETPQSSYPTIVPPVLPGPVDMRTYSNSYDAHPNNESYNHLLGAFASGTADHQLPDIDEDFEKELHTALTAKKPEEPTPTIETAKVSLSDSRNQLKVKIKGPFLDANYASAAASLPPQSTVVALDPIVASGMVGNASVSNTISFGAVSATSGSSNLRRMRKKELLRQYCTQNMNVDESASVPGFGQAAAPTATPPVNRTSITIPKAVASMTTIPTRDDYRDYRTGSDEIIDTKIRKDKPRYGGLSRELRHLDMSLDEDGMPERRRSIGSTGSNASIGLSTSYDSALASAYKRRGRPAKPQTTPKLKIKLGGAGNRIVGDTVSTIDDKKVRPPKKRLSSTTKPRLVDLKRESMKFRRKVMADFDEDKKKRKGERDKSGKKKKRKSRHEVQIISNETANPTKLIFRFGKKKESESDNKRTNLSDGKVSAEQKNVEVLGEQDSRTDLPSVNPDQLSNSVDLSGGSGGASALRKVRSNKVTPIKLKLSRCQEGSGYVMSGTGTEEQQQHPLDSPPSPSIALPEPPVHNTTCTPLLLNKDCEVR